MGARRGVISQPKKLESIAVKRIMENALWTQGVRKKLERGKKRHEFQADHGYRKWFKTRCELAGMKSVNIETIMGHSIGISDSYYRVTENELLEDYLKAVDSLTINNEYALEREMIIIRETSENNYNSLKAELYSKEKEINFLKESDKRKDEDMRKVKSQVQSIMGSLAILKPEDKTKVAKELFRKGIFKEN